MSIMPGSLDYLYYEGITPCIPYEAYGQLPATASGMAEISGIPMTPQPGNLKQAVLSGENPTMAYSDVNNQNYGAYNGYGSMQNTYNNSYTMDYSVGNSSAINQNQYQNSISNMKGAQYGNYANSHNSFLVGGNSRNPQYDNSKYSTVQNTAGAGIGGNYPINYTPYGNDVFINSNDKNSSNGEKNFREEIIESAKSAKESVLNSGSTFKGLLSAGLILLTAILLFRGKKKSNGAGNSSFFQKINPKNWFK